MPAYQIFKLSGMYFREMRFNPSARNNSWRNRCKMQRIVNVNQNMLTLLLYEEIVFDIITYTIMLTSLTNNNNTRIHDTAYIDTTTV